MNRIWETLKPWAINLISYTAFFIVIFLAAWFSNGYYGTHFDLTALMSFYGVLVAKNVGIHITDSVYNSPRDQSPKK